MAAHDDPETRAERLRDLLEEFRTRVENKVERATIVARHATQTLTQAKAIIGKNRGKLHKAS